MNQNAKSSEPEDTLSEQNITTTVLFGFAGTSHRNDSELLNMTDRITHRITSRNETDATAASCFSLGLLLDCCLTQQSAGAIGGVQFLPMSSPWRTRSNIRFPPHFCGLDDLNERARMQWTASFDKKNDWGKNANMSEQFYYLPRLTHDELCTLTDVAAHARKCKAHALGEFVMSCVSDELERRRHSMSDAPKEFDPYTFPPLDPRDTSEALRYLSVVLDGDWYYRQSNGTQDFLSYCFGHVRALASAWLINMPSTFPQKAALCRK